jgi:hypothetical protein
MYRFSLYKFIFIIYVFLFHTLTNITEFFIHIYIGTIGPSDEKPLLTVWHLVTFVIICYYFIA